MTPSIEWIREGVGFIPPAAAAFRRANAQVRDEFGRDIDVNSTYRSRDQQMAMHLASVAYLNGTGPYPGHSWAVHPDESFHVAGTALDSDDWMHARIVEILAENEFIRNRLYVPGEQHHFEWLRDRDRNYGQPAGVSSEEIDLYDDKAQSALFAKIEAESRPFATYIRADGKTRFLVGPGGASWHIPNMDYFRLLVNLGLTSNHVVGPLPDNQWAFMIRTRQVLAPDPLAAQVDAVLDLSAEDAAAIAAQIDMPTVILSDAQLEQITAAAREGGSEAVKGLTFVAAVQ